MPKVTYNPNRRYRIKAKWDGYDKQTYGVKFHDGEATIDPENWKNATQRTPEQVLDGIQADFPDFAVEAYGGTGLHTVPDLDHLRTPDGRLRTAADVDETEDEPKPRRGNKRRAQTED